MEAIAAVVESVGALGGELTEAEWALPTVCDGWSVKDHVAHLADGACTGLQLPRPDHATPSGLAHVKSPAGEWMEIGVDFRRTRLGDEVVGEFRTRGAELVAFLRSLDDAGFEETIRGPLGYEMPRAGLVGILPLDWWMHEQDIRRATIRPGHIDGPAAEYARDRLLGIADGMLSAADPPIAAEFVVDGPVGTVRVLGAGDPVDRLHLGLPALAAAGGGRVAPEALLANGEVKAEGDAAGAAHILSLLKFTP